MATLPKKVSFGQNFDFCFFWLIGKTIGETEKSHFKVYRNLKYHKASIFFKQRKFPFFTDQIVTFVGFGFLGL